MNTKPYRPYAGRKKHPVLTALIAVVVLLLILFIALRGYIRLHSSPRLPGAGQEVPRVMVIFGCRVMPDGSPSLSLKDRLDTALDWLGDHPDTTVVVSGGKGDDEHLSEARCMADYLIAHGWPRDKVLLEDQARDTWENVKFSIALLREKGYDPTQPVLAVSSDFHLGRIRMLYGRAQGGPDTVYTLPAPVTHQSSRIQMFFREPIALVSSFLLNR